MHANQHGEKTLKKCEEADGLRVSSVSLDDLWLTKLNRRRVDVLCLDLYGYELLGMIGGRAMFAEAPPRFLVLKYDIAKIIYVSGLLEYLEFLRRHHYSVVFITGWDLHTNHPSIHQLLPEDVWNTLASSGANYDKEFHVILQHECWKAMEVSCRINED